MPLLTALVSLQGHHVSAKTHQAKTGQRATIHRTDVTLSDIQKLCMTDGHTVLILFIFLSLVQRTDYIRKRI
jgi:hypothetical protein